MTNNTVNERRNGVNSFKREEERGLITRKVFTAFWELNRSYIYNGKDRAEVSAGPFATDHPPALCPIFNKGVQGSTDPDGVFIENKIAIKHAAYNL